MELTKTTEIISTKDKELDDLRRELGLKSESITSQGNLLEKRDSEMEQLRLEKEEIISRRDETLKQKDKEMENLREDVLKSRKELQEKDKTLREREEEVILLRKEISSKIEIDRFKEEAIRKRDETILAKEEENAKLRKDLLAVEEPVTFGFPTVKDQKQQIDTKSSITKNPKKFRSAIRPKIISLH